MSCSLDSPERSKNLPVGLSKVPLRESARRYIRRKRSVSGMWRRRVLSEVLGMTISRVPRVPRVGGVWTFSLDVLVRGHGIHIYIHIISKKAVFCLQAKKPLHSGLYEHRVPKIKIKTFFCTRNVYLYIFLFVYLFICVIQHRNWPHGSTMLNAHGTNAGPDGLFSRTHTNEAFSCWFCVNSFRVDRARRGNVSLSSQGMVSYRSACPEN